MEQTWVKVLFVIFYIIVTGIIWTAGIYVAGRMRTPYDPENYYVNETERTGKHVSATRLIVGILLLLSCVFVWIKGVETIWLLLYEQVGVLGLVLVLTCVRVRRTYRLVSIYPIIVPNTVATVDNAVIGCWGFWVVAIAVAVYTTAAVFI